MKTDAKWYNYLLALVQMSVVFSATALGVAAVVGLCIRLARWIIAL